MNYKNSKCQFRRHLRKAQFERDREVHEQVDNSSDIDINQFWRSIKRKRAKKQSCSNEMMFDNNVILREPGQIREGWATYFESLYSPLNNNNNNNNNLYFRHMVHRNFN